MNANKHLLLWSSLGTLLVLVWASISENFLQDWQRIQSRVKKSLPADRSAEFRVQLRQVVVPDLHTVDRCVSCHVGMVAGETGIEGDPIYGRHAPIAHDPSKFGCTTCHGGQGRATTLADAHGAVPHWPEPLIPRRYIYAGCGSCHTHLAVPSVHALERGEILFERYDCLACHRVDGRGGTYRPGEKGGKEGPDLTVIGLKGYEADWYERHLKRRQSERSEVWLSAFGEIAPEDRKLLEEYVTARVGATQLLAGKSLFHSLGCRGCHKIGGVGGSDGPDLSYEGQKNLHAAPFHNVPLPHTLENWLKAHFRDPAAVVPGSQMPRLDLSEEQIELLTYYMLSLRRGKYPEAYWPRDRVRAERLGQREFATDGATLYNTFCSACHGQRGEGMRYPGVPVFPAVANRDFLEIAGDDFLYQTIERGRTGRRMPAWQEPDGGLRPKEIQAIIAYLRELGGNVAERPDERPARWASGSVERGAALYRENCAACHGESGTGTENPELRNRDLLSVATDTYFYETIRRGRRNTIMGGFAQGSPVRRSLSEEEIVDIVTYIRSWEEKKEENK